MMRTLLLLGVILLSSPLYAQERQVKLRGGSSSFNLGSFRAGDEVTVFGTSKGNSSAPVRISVYGPKGFKVKAEAAKMVGSLKATLKKQKSFYQIKLRSDKELEREQQTCADFSQGEVLSEEEPEFDPNSIVSTTDPICDEYSAADISALAEALTETYGGSWDAGRVCGYLVSIYRGGAGEGPPPPFPAATPPPLPVSRVSKKAPSSFVTEDFAAFLEKDSCSSENDTYIFRVKIKIPANVPSSGYLRVRLFETKHYGGKEATIKPVSDGKFAPQPLLLMNYLGFCGQKIRITKWSQNKPFSSADTEVSDLIHYRDLILTRTPIGRYLIGGEATISLFDSNSGYGACFELQRKRQRVNGYPG